MPRDIIILECTEARAEGKTVSRYVSTRNKKSLNTPGRLEKKRSIIPSFAGTRCIAKLSSPWNPKLLNDGRISAEQTVRCRDAGSISLLKRSITRIRICCANS